MEDSQPVIDSSSSYALIIGIGSYADSTLNLKCTKADAMAFYNLLLNNAHAGFKPENVKLLLDQDATLLNLKKAVSGWLFQNASTESTVVVYFAGHGGQEPDKVGSEKDGLAKYLLPYDCDKTDLFSSALSNIEFDRLLKTIKARRLVFFMDACHSGGLSRSGSRSIGIVEDVTKKLAEGEGRLVIASAKPNQLSWEDEKIGHGIFTYHLLEALEGKADTDGDGYVSIIEVYKYLEQKVPLSVRQRADSLQEPQLWGDLTKDIFLTANADLVKQKKAEILHEIEERRKANREKQKQLFELFETGKMGSDIYSESLNLLSKDAESYNGQEKRLISLLQAVLKDAISVETYMDMRETIMSIPETVKERGVHQQTQPSFSTVFCTNCGARLSTGLSFCTNCGKRTG
ncbi:MAG: caspase family protein [Bacteroidia bacterium]